MLSNLYLCPMTNNKIFKKYLINFVVNCFQICIFVLWQTTASALPRCASCCELLSNLYLCPMTNNLIMMLVCMILVVNCFQICIFVLWQTTLSYIVFLYVWLWIAFKFVSLSYDKQLNRDVHNLSFSCELLSNLYLCPMTNNT